MKNKFSFLFLAPAALLVLASCSNFLEMSSAPGGKGTLVINSGGGSRTLGPDNAGFTRFSLVFSSPEKTSVEISDLSSLDYSQELEAGTWTISAAAYADAVKLAEGSAEVPVTGGKTTRVSIALSPVQGGMGTLKYTVEYPPSFRPGSGVITLKPLPEGEQSVINVLYGSEDSRSFPSGQYLAIVSLDFRGEKIGKSEVVHIYPGMETAAEFSFSDGDLAREKALLILQAYGAGTPTDGQISHSFVELYNNTDSDFNLDGYSVQYTNSTTDGVDWDVKDLSGKIVPPKSSFLIRGKKQNDGARLDLSGTAPDVDWTDQAFNHKNFKICLIENTVPLNVANPFDTDGSGTKAAGYVDMLGAGNETDTRGYEVAVANVISKNKSARRKSLVDTDNNADDFKGIDYRITAVSDEELDYYAPKNSGHGAWNPDAPPGSQGAEKLMILQVYGTGEKTDGAVSHSFIELYNNTGSDINLGAYSIQYSQTQGGADWAKLDLDGIIPAYGSYLIRGTVKNENPRLDLAADDYGGTPDKEWDIVLSNVEFKLCLLSGQSLLNDANPFDTDDSGTKTAGYVDMLGAADNDGVAENPPDAAKDPGYGYLIDAGEGSTRPELLSKQKSARRKSLNDTDDNDADFENIDYRADVKNNPSIIDYKPRNSRAGAWNPYP
jgi:hypothetical protein